MSRLFYALKKANTVCVSVTRVNNNACQVFRDTYVFDHVKHVPTYVRARGFTYICEAAIYVSYFNIYVLTGDAVKNFKLKF